MFLSTIEFKKKERFRSKSMHQIRNPKYGKELKEDDDSPVTQQLSFYENINKKFLKYKEIKMFYKKTKIPPFYLFAIIITFLGLIIINVFNKNLSLSFSTVYPLFMTFKALQYYDVHDSESKEEIIHWLKYWVFYGVLLNLETWFSFFLKQFYTFCKIILLMNCFPVKSGLLEYIYSLILNLFSRYENLIVGFSSNVYEHLIDEKEGEENENIGTFINMNIQDGKAAIKLIKKII